MSNIKVIIKVINGYVLKVSKATVKSFFEEGSWDWDTMTSVLVEKNGKVFQIFGSKGSYGNVDDYIEMINSNSGRSLGWAKIVNNEVKFIAKASGYYVFK